MYRLAIGVVFVLISAVALAATEPSISPTQRIKTGTNEIFRILKDASLDRQAKWEKISTVLYDGFDFRSMSQSVLATNWQTASPDEKLKFIEYFSQYLEQVYREKIEKYTNQTVEYIEETVTEDRAVVDTVIVTSGTRIPVTYKMKNNEGEWMIYDVAIEGVSLVSSYRAKYSELVKNDGMEGLLNDMRAQLEASRADYLLQQQEAGASN